VSLRRKRNRKDPTYHHIHIPMKTDRKANFTVHGTCTVDSRRVPIAEVRVQAGHEYLVQLLVRNVCRRTLLTIKKLVHSRAKRRDMGGIHLTILSLTSMQEK
jgi:hypothetical protein